MNYGKAFREIREEQGLSRTEVAKQIGCTPSALSKIENGKTVPKEKTIAKFCVAYGIPIAYFYTRAFTREDFISCYEKFPVITYVPKNLRPVALAKE